jgi:hypothetical protein
LHYVLIQGHREGLKQLNTTINIMLKTWVHVIA